MARHIHSKWCGQSCPGCNLLQLTVHQQHFIPVLSALRAIFSFYNNVSSK